MNKNISDLDLPIAKEVAKQSVKKIRAVESLKKNWRFVAICLTVLLCVGMVCGTAYGITCHISTLDAIKEIAYATEVVYETTTETATADNNGVANVGDSNTITLGGDK